MAEEQGVEIHEGDEHSFTEVIEEQIKRIEASIKTLQTSTGTTTGGTLVNQHIEHANTFVDNVKKGKEAEEPLADTVEKEIKSLEFSLSDLKTSSSASTGGSPVNEHIEHLTTRLEEMKKALAKYKGEEEPVFVHEAKPKQMSGDKDTAGLPKAVTTGELPKPGDDKMSGGSPAGERIDELARESEEAHAVDGTSTDHTGGSQG